MTDQELEELLEMFPNIPSPLNQPLKFKYYYNLYKYIKSTEKEK